MKISMDSNVGSKGISKMILFDKSKTYDLSHLHFDKGEKISTYNASIDTDGSIRFNYTCANMVASQYGILVIWFDDWYIDTSIYKYIAIEYETTGNINNGYSAMCLNTYPNLTKDANTIIKQNIPTNYNNQIVICPILNLISNNFMIYIADASNGSKYFKLKKVYLIKDLTF